MNNDASQNGSTVETKKTKSRKQAEPEIDFTKALDEELPDIFAPPKNPKSLLMPGSRAPCNTTLPEDCHYQPEDLVKLFLLPNVMVILQLVNHLESDGSSLSFPFFHFLFAK